MLFPSYKLLKDRSYLPNLSTDLPFNKQARRLPSRKSLVRFHRKSRLIKKIDKSFKYLCAVGEHFVFPTSFNSNLRFMMTEFKHLALTRGLKFAITRFKESRLCFTKALCEQPIQIQGISTNKLGFPTWFASRLPPILSNSDVRMWLTLLSVSRAFTLPPVLDTETIVEKSNSVINLSDKITMSDILNRELGVRPKFLKWTDPHMSTKAGPNGQALLTSLHDLTLLPLQLVEDLKLLGGKRLIQYWHSLSAGGQAIPNPVEFFSDSFEIKTERNSIRRLSFFSDKEGKSRVIAIVDYWSQSVLKPLHDHLNSILKGISSDCTYNQNHFLSCLKHGPYWSLDLRAATDRMPVDLQEFVIRHILGSTRASAWKRVLTQWEFTTKDGPVSYGAGQPMGAYSSWPSMALTHHVIVRLAARRVGITNFSDYSLLGDDIVIANDKVAESYKILLRQFDMPISEQKSHMSANTYEFAKRWIRNGEEVTGFSLSGLLTVTNNYPLFSNFIETQQLHGLSFKQSSGPEHLLVDLMKCDGKYQQSVRTAKLLKIFTLMKDILLRDEASKLESLLDCMALPKISYDLFLKIVRICLKNQCASDISELNVIRSRFCYKIMDLTDVELGYEAQVSDLLYNFILETHPIGRLFSISVGNSIDDWEKIKKGEIGDVLDVWKSSILQKSRFSLDVFSMRNCHSQVFNQSRLVKDLWRLLKKYFDTVVEEEDLQTVVKKKVLGVNS